MRLPMPAIKSLFPSSWDNTIDMVTKELIQKEIEFFSVPYREEILDLYVFSSSEQLDRYWFHSTKCMMKRSYVKSKTDIIRPT